MWLSVLAAQKSRSCLLPQSSFHGDPPFPSGCGRRAPGGSRWGFGLGWRGLSEAQVAGWGPWMSGRAAGRGDASVEAEQRCKVKQDAAGKAAMSPARPAHFRDPGSGSNLPPSSNPLLPQRPKIAVPGAGWPWGASGSAGQRGAAVAARREQLDVKAGGATQLWRTDRVAPAATGAATARGLAQGQDARKHTASQREEPPPVWSLFGREKQSPKPGH